MMNLIINTAKIDSGNKDAAIKIIDIDQIIASRGCLRIFCRFSVSRFWQLYMFVCKSIRFSMLMFFKLLDQFGASSLCIHHQIMRMQLNWKKSHFEEQKKTSNLHVKGHLILYSAFDFMIVYYAAPTGRHFNYDIAAVIHSTFRFLHYVREAFN